MKVNHLVDDMDGTLEDVISTTFCIDGKVYEIDLTLDNFELLKQAVAPFTKVARLIKPSPSRSKGSANRVRSQAQNTKIRNWARSNGFNQLPDRGRLPDSVIAAYRTAHDG